VIAPRGKRAPRRPLLFGARLLALAAAGALLQCRAAVTPHLQAPPPACAPSVAVSESRHLALGVPIDADASDDLYLDEQAYVLSYNPRRRAPNWVAWRLDRSDLGKVHRSNDFRADPSLPAPLYRVDESDYRHSGYDRGHLCPSADRSSSAIDNSRTFLFTNMLPQLHELNAGPWEQLEAFARLRAKRGQVVYNVAGGVYGAPFHSIGHGVQVPSADFKVLVILNEGESAADVTAQTCVIAVMMPNEPGVAQRDWSEYTTSVDAVEAASGYDFLNAIPEPIQRIVEARSNCP